MDGTDSYFNALGQPVGAPVPDWTPRPIPERTVFEGRFCTLEPLNADRHARALWEANSLDVEGRTWTYLAYGPFDTFEAYRAWVEQASVRSDILFFAIIDKAPGCAVGIASYLRIDPANGCIEVGHLHFSPRLQQQPAATEAMYLMMERVFALGYRRYEWKCDALNTPSRRAAQRFGFTFEGIFRQAVVVKGRNRDTAWYAILDSEWPALRDAFCRWLDPANFHADGRQIVSLASLTSVLPVPKR